MGGSSKSSSSTTQYYDQKIGAEDSIVASQGGTITITDGGIVQDAFDFASVVVSQLGENVRTTNDTIMNSTQQAIDTLANAQKSETAQTMDKLLNTTALVAGGLLLYKVLK